MSKTHKVSIILALAMLTALGVSLIRGWPPLASAAGQVQPPESDTLFFVSGSQPGIQRMAAGEPRQLAQQATFAATESIPFATGMCDIAGLHASPNGRWVAVEVGCEASVHTLVMTAATGEIRPVWPETWQSGFFLNWAPDGDSFLMRVGHLGESAVFLVNVQNMHVERNVVALALESNIYVADVATGEVKVVTRFEGALVEAPTWSPDGAWLAMSTDAGGTPDIWVVGVATGEVQQVTRNANARCPVWVAGRQ